MAKFRFSTVAVSGIAAALPKNSISTDSYTGIFGDKVVADFKNSSGIHSLHRAEDLQTTSDLGYIAARDLLSSKNIDPDSIGILLFLSKTPDYRSPATAIVLHNRLGLSLDCIAYDVNMGGAGFTYGLQIGCSLLDTVNKPYALVIMGDTAGKQLAAKDPSIMQYGDGAAAILLEKNSNAPQINVATYSAGSNFKSFIVPGGAFRTNNLHTIEGDDMGRTGEHVRINQQEVHDFAVRKVPQAIEEFLKNTGKSLQDFQFIALQQDSDNTLSSIAGSSDISYEYLPKNQYKFGNTGGASIPLLLCDHLAGRAADKINVLCAGYGEGFSWGVAGFTVDPADILPVIFTDEAFTEGFVTHEM